MTPSEFHAPPRIEKPDVAPHRSHNVIGGFPLASTFFSLVPTAKPMNRLSGDQNTGSRTPSVPASGRASVESSDRIHSCQRPSELAAGKATFRPSGESTGLPRVGASGGAKI